MSEESDFRDVLRRAVEGGAFDDLWEASEGSVRRWRVSCVERALGVVGEPEGWEIVGVEAALPVGKNLRPKFLVVPKSAPPRDKKETGQ